MWKELQWLSSESKESVLSERDSLTMLMIQSMTLKELSSLKELLEESLLKTECQCIKQLDTQVS